jgi:hypothetical protein
MPLFWYQYLCGFSSQLVFEFSYTILYNLIFTATPVAALGIFERDISKEFTHLVPTIYLFGVKNKGFKRFRFWTFMFEGAYQSLACFYVTIAVYNEIPIDVNGHTPIDVELGTVMAIMAILNANLFVFSRLHAKTLISTLFIMVPTLLVFIWTAIYGFFPESGLKDIGHKLFLMPNFYLTLIIGVIICHFPRLVIAFIHQLYWPTDIQLIQELESLGAKMTDSVDEFKYQVEPHEISDVSTGSLGLKTDGSALLGPQKSISGISMPSAKSSDHWIDVEKGKLTPLQSTAKVHFNAPVLTVTAATPTKVPSFSEDQRSQTDSVAERQRIQLNVMTRGMDFDQRGFSFSESPGTRDLILGRKDVRMTPSPRRLDPRPIGRTMTYASTRSVPGNMRMRPRASTFTYGKRKRRLSMGQINFNVEDYESRRGSEGDARDEREKEGSITGRSINSL